MSATAHGMPPQQTRLPRGPALAVVTFAILVAGLAGFLLVGERPEPPRAGEAPRLPPPLVMPPNVAADDLRARGAAALKRGDLAGATDLFDRSLERDPDDTVALVGLALASWQQGAPQRTLAQLEQLAETTPDDPWPWLSLGVAQAWRGDLDGAREPLDRARSLGWQREETMWVARRADDLLHPGLAPGYPPLLVAPDQALDAAGRAEIAGIGEALRTDDRPEARRRALAADPALVRRDPAVAIAVAVASFSKDSPQTAETAVRTALERHPSFAAHAHLQLGVLLLWQGDPDGARRHLRIAERAGGQTRELARELIVAIP